MHHHALKLHFTTKYDYIKYHGKTRFQVHEKFLMRKDRMLYYRIGCKYGSNRIVQFFIANMIKNPGKWIADFYGEGPDEVYSDWVTRTESVTRFFGEDMEHVFGWCRDNGVDPKTIMVAENGKYPRLFDFLIKDLIYPETYVIMDKLTGFINAANCDDAIWNDWNLRMRKYSPFLKIDRDMIGAALKRCINSRAIV